MTKTVLAKLHEYGISLNIDTFIYSYLKRQNQNVKIRNVIY